MKHRDAIPDVMSDPYREPGEAPTIEQRRDQLKLEIHALYSMNAYGRTHAELQQSRARIAEIHRLLAALS